MKCKNCEEEFSDKRASLGYEICLKCGEEEATQEKIKKSKRIAPAYNKGAYQYITSPDVVKGIYKK